MKIVGLTGSIATGKSTVAGWIRQLGIPIHDADAAVHQLLGVGGDAVEPILALFGPAAGSSVGGIDRKAVGDLVFAAPERRRKLEAILHPMVRAHRDDFLAVHRQKDASVVVLDIPLLFETRGDQICDYVIVVHAKTETLMDRALARPGMTRDKLNGILASQMPMADKMARADLLLDTDLAPIDTKRQLEAWLDKLKMADAKSDNTQSADTKISKDGGA